MKILIKNATLISVDEKRNEIEYNMDILIEENKISKIDKNINEVADKIIDADNKIVMPGLINTHAHVGMSIFRETLAGYTLQDWLEQKIWPMEDKMTPEDIYYGSYLSFLEMIKNGTTTINDMYFHPEVVIKAMNETGIRLQVTRTFMDIAGSEDGERRFDEYQKILDEFKETNRVTFNAAVHGLYTCSGPYIDKCIEFARKNNIIVHAHFCENSKELSDNLKLQGKSSVEVLKEKFSNVKTILAHCVKLSKEDIDEIKNMNISVAHCPVSNLKLGCGVANISYMLDSGINVSLGTDGQGSGDNLDLFESMKLCALLQKGLYEDPTKINSYDVIKMATINGAKALGIDNEVGSIEVNKKADLIIIDNTKISTKPVNDLLSQIVYNINGNDVITTIVDGNILMENRKLTNTHENEIVEKCEKIFERLV